MKNPLRITVCQLSDQQAKFKEEWIKLSDHVQQNKSDLLLLPELAFSEWLSAEEKPSLEDWKHSVSEHALSLKSLPLLSLNTIIGTRPLHENGISHNEAFIWQKGTGLKPSHQKYYLPDEPGFYEASWYQRGPKEFRAEDIGFAKVGCLICTEMWFTEHARDYARQGIHLLAVPRATERSTTDRWLAGGRAAAVMSGAFCLSSNKAGSNNGVDFGGCGWVIDPSGNVLATTSEEAPFAAVEIDLEEAVQAKDTYPRYVKE